MACDDQQSGQREVLQACRRVETATCLLDLLARSRAKAEQRYGVRIKAIVIQEAGLDGFSIHRLLLAHGIESHVIDSASIAVDPLHRRVKTDAIDGETLLRTLMAWARGERRVCSMVRAPSPETRSPALDARARHAAQGTHSAYQSDQGPAQRPRRPGLQSASARSFRTAPGASYRRLPWLPPLLLSGFAENSI